MAKTDDATQELLMLTPDEPPDLMFKELHPAEIIVRQFPKPNAALRHSVASWGVMQAVLVHDKGGQYVAVDGNRRVLAARDADKLVPCMVSADLGYLKHVATMMLNNTRERNLIAEMESIDALLLTGASVEAIARSTGTSTATIQKRMKLRTLNPMIRRMVEDGMVANGTAERIAKLNATDQQRLVDKVRASTTKESGVPDKTRGVITDDDVKAVRRATSQQAAMSLDPSLFDDPQAVGTATGDYDNFAVAVDHFVGAVKSWGKTQAETIAAIKAEWKQKRTD